VKDFAKGCDLFRSLCILHPEDASNHYNLCCSYSLLGNIDSALASLTTAVNLGFTDVQHMRGDSDLDAIRYTPQFTQIINDIEHKFFPSEIIKPLPVSSDEVLPQLVVPVDVAPQSAEAPKPSVEPPKPSVEPPKPSVEPPKPSSVESPQIVSPPVVLSNQLTAAQVKWASELSVLHDIGFVNDEVLIPLLVSFNGSVERTVLELLS